MMMGNWGQFIYLTDVNYRYLQLDRFYLLATGMASREVTKAILWEYLWEHASCMLQYTHTEMMLK